jgi:hypothetical protein
LGKVRRAVLRTGADLSPTIVAEVRYLIPRLRNLQRTVARRLLPNERALVRARAKELRARSRDRRHRPETMAATCGTS